MDKRLGKKRGRVWRIFLRLADEDKEGEGEGEGEGTKSEDLWQSRAGQNSLQSAATSLCSDQGMR